MTVSLSLLNFRDVGGLETRLGRSIRTGVILRSEGPASFLADHRRELSELGIKLVCDLRSGEERELAPNDWAGEARLLSVEMSGGDIHSKHQGSLKKLIESKSSAAAREIMLQTYSRMPKAFLARIGALVSAIADGETPALVHCTAGKDRTGVVVGLLLLLAGAPREAVLADYMRSEIFEQNLRRGTVSISDYFESRLGARLDEEVAGAMVGVETRLLNAAFQTVDEQWGSVEAYFTAAGVDDGLQRKFIAAMVQA